MSISLRSESLFSLIAALVVERRGGVIWNLPQDRVHLHCIDNRLMHQNKSKSNANNNCSQRAGRKFHLA